MNRFKEITKVLWLIMLANILVAAVKLCLGFLLKINSLTADGFHAITDSTSNIIGLIGIKFASKPADKEHPYGHQKYETISGFIIGIMLLFITFQIIYKAIMWFSNPTTPTIPIPSIILLVITLFINIFVAYYEYKRGKQLESDVLISDSFHTRSDILISIGVLIAMVLIKLGIPAIIDPILSLIIALFIFRSCYEIFKMTMAVLVDKKVIDEKNIYDIVLSVDKDIIDVHKIRSRGRSDQIFIDLHIITQPDKTVKDAHVLSHAIEQKLRDDLKLNIELIAHIEPNERNIEENKA